MHCKYKKGVLFQTALFILDVVSWARKVGHFLKKKKKKKKEEMATEKVIRELMSMRCCAVILFVFD